MKTLTKIASGLLLIASGAAHSATVVQNSSPTFWGSTGDHADLVIYYDANATGAINVTKFYISQLGGLQVDQLQQGCHLCTPIYSGNTQIGNKLQPGGYVFVRGFKTNNSVTGTATIADATGNTNNINAHVRTSLEIRNHSDDVLTHSEVR
jgi:hypothetical protein